MSLLEELFISRVRVGIISLFIRNPDQNFHIREITRRVKTEINAIRRELHHLTKLGFLKREPRGNRVYFEMKKSFPFYEEFASLVFKEEGFGRTILDNFDKIGKIKWAFASKEFSKGSKPAPGRIDLFIVGDADLNGIENIISQEQTSRGFDINYSVMTEGELIARAKRHDPFLIRVLSEPRVTIFGDESKMLPFKVG